MSAVWRVVLWPSTLCGLQAGRPDDGRQATVSHVAFWNPGPPDRAHPDSLCDAVLGGLAREYHPRAIVLAETIGRRFQPLPGYQQVRDFRPAGRANLTLFYREDCHERRVWWADLEQTWTRWSPKTGQHPARSILVAGLGNVQLVAAHQPPLGTDNTDRAQREGIGALERIMAPWKHHAMELPGRDAMVARPRLLLWDPNHDPESGAATGQKYLAHRIGGWVHGGKTDGAVHRGGLTVMSEGMVTHAGGVAIPTDDHRGAYVMRLRLNAGLSW